jgi:putative FmdB family regulatory protein
MPIYEYRCQTCGRKTSIFWRSLTAINEKAATCHNCGSKRLVRLISRVRVVRGGGGDDLGPSGDVDAGMMSELDNLDENDPRTLGRFMRKMAQETGEDMGPEFEEVVGRLEKGEDPEKIEQSMGDMFGDEGMGPGGMGPGGMGMDDDYGAPSEDPTAKADKEAEAKDKKATEKRRTVAMKGKTKTSKAGEKKTAKKKTKTSRIT